MYVVIALLFRTGYVDVGDGVGQGVIIFISGFLSKQYILSRRSTPIRETHLERLKLISKLRLVINSGMWGKWSTGQMARANGFNVCLLVCCPFWI